MAIISGLCICIEPFIEGKLSFELNESYRYEKITGANPEQGYVRLYSSEDELHAISELDPYVTVSIATFMKRFTPTYQEDDAAKAADTAIMENKPIEEVEEE